MKKSFDKCQNPVRQYFIVVICNQLPCNLIVSFSCHSYPTTPRKGEEMSVIHENVFHSCFDVNLFGNECLPSESLDGIEIKRILLCFCWLVVLFCEGRRAL
jgi:hypothetical protein